LKASITDVAKKSGVSTTTVSRVLREYPGVRKKTRRKVLEAISELKYEVNAVARNLRQRKTNSIGVIVGNVLSPFYSIIAKTVEDIANKWGYSTILCNGDEDSEKELRYLKILKSNRVDGIILAPTGKNSHYINWMIDSGVKIVLLDRLIKGTDCDAVLVDNENGSYKAVKYLIEQGYQKIGIINGYLDRTTGRERLNGYLRALKEADISPDDNLIKIGNFKEDSGIKLTKELLENSNRPQAIFATNMDMTLGAVITIKKMSINIPDELGIIGFDDPEWASIVSPPLTVVSQPTYALASTAAELLIKKIEDKKIATSYKPLIMTLNTKLVIRNSTQKIKSHLVKINK